jgi:hypothetical protein
MLQGLINSDPRYCCYIQLQSYLRRACLICLLAAFFLFLFLFSSVCVLNVADHILCCTIGTSMSRASMSMRCVHEGLTAWRDWDIHSLLPPVDIVAANIACGQSAGADRCPGPDLQPLAAAGDINDLASTRLIITMHCNMCAGTHRPESQSRERTSRWAATTRVMTATGAGHQHLDDWRGRRPWQGRWLLRCGGALQFGTELQLSINLVEKCS